jgi:hypothetical protein
MDGNDLIIGKKKSPYNNLEVIDGPKSREETPQKGNQMSKASSGCILCGSAATELQAPIGPCDILD